LSGAAFSPGVTKLMAELTALSGAAQTLCTESPEDVSVPATATAANLLKCTEYTPAS
jgi:hypothetical protein